MPSQLGYFIKSPPGEEIVITGIAGTFPKSENIDVFREKLYNKENLIEENYRWNINDFPHGPSHAGLIGDLSRFDNTFFGINTVSTETMDPQARILLEKAYEAILDAGVNPETLRNSKTGVYVGTCISESENGWFHQVKEKPGYAMLGNSRAMLANRISCAMALKGPSYAIDTACSSSCFALENAYKAMKTGEIESALVCGSNIMLSPISSLIFNDLGVLSPDCICKSFDEEANGYVRSEGIAVLFLQRTKSAKRIYAEVYHAKINCDGYKSEGITFPSAEVQAELLKDFYNEISFNPHDVDFVECHGTGTKVGDPQEIQAVDSTLTVGRKTPLLIGSLKSSIGHSEPASGILSIIKLCYQMYNGIIAPNINLKNVKKELTPIIENRMKVVTEAIPYEGEWAALNNFGFGGANAHVLLRRHNIKKRINNGKPTDNTPRLVCVSGRTQEAVTHLIDLLKSKPTDEEFVALFYNIFKKNIPRHMFKGYVILDDLKSENKSILQDIRPTVEKKKPLWFLFSATGSQWPGMAKTLMSFPVCVESIKRSADILKPKGVDLYNIILTDDPTKLNKNSIVGIAAIQVALTDLLFAIGIRPDHIIGHSFGELICAYADGCVTQQETILAAFTFSLAASQPVIQPAVKSKLLTSLQSIISDPKPRSQKWILNCEQENEWESDKSKYSSAEYYVNSFVHPVVPEDAFKRIQTDAIVIEIAVENLLHKCLEQTLPKTTANFLLLHAGEDCTSFLNTLGRIHNEGVAIDLSPLYPKVKFPVSAGTPSISPHIRWDHSKTWFTWKHDLNLNMNVSQLEYAILSKSEEHRFLLGHVIDGRCLFPATAYLNMIWESVCAVYSYPQFSPVVFENVRFERATTIPEQSPTPTVFTTVIQITTGDFEITESGNTVVTGRVSLLDDSVSKLTDDSEFVENESNECYVPLNSKDFYKELRLRGYNYKGLFRSVHECSVSGKSSKISWNNNWVAFMDCMLQMKIINFDTRSLYVPTSIEKIIIDSNSQLPLLENSDEDQTLDCHYNSYLDIIKAGGVEFRGLRATAISRRKHIAEPVLEEYKFIPYHLNSKLSYEDASRICAQIALENQPQLKVKLVEKHHESKELLSLTLAQVLGELPLIQTEVTVLSTNKISDLPEDFTVENARIHEQTNVSFVIDCNLLSSNHQSFAPALSALREGGYVISREDSQPDVSQPKIIASIPVNDGYLVLTNSQKEKPTTKVIEITNKSLDHFEWITPIKECIRKKQSLVLFAQNEPTNGIIGFINCLRKEPGGEQIRCVFITDNDAPKFDINLPLYKDQLIKNLAINVFKHRTWGSFRHLKYKANNSINTRHTYGDIKTPGDLTTLDWFSGSLNDDNEENLVEIYYSALNFHDVVIATGKVSKDIMAKSSFDPNCEQGIEFSGRTCNGKRVMGMVGGGSIGTRIIADPQLVWEIPDSWSLEDAATVSVVYSTAYHALVTVGRIKSGMKVLIHAGTGGVGQAGINLALYYGCTVFTTVGTQEKRDFIKKTYPQITDEYIGNSRDTSFEQMIYNHTNGRGVDLVLNSLAEEKLQASLRCLAAGGKFLEIGKFDLSRNSQMGMKRFSKGTSFHGIVLDIFFNREHPSKKVLLKSIAELIQKGAIKPLPRTVFMNNELEKAYRFMAQGKHLGKVLINVRKEEAEKLVLPKAILMSSRPRFFCDSSKSYVVIGGLGGFGLELVNWLILKGAKNIVICSRTGISNGYQAMKIRLWRQKQVTIEISTANLKTEEGVISVLHKASLLGPVDGIFNLAVVLRDALFEDQTEESFRTSLHCKALATQNFDKISRKMCPTLRHFVVFSSVSCGRGNIGQSNYGMANSIMERICEQRKDDKLPALAIQWGAIGDVGLVADMQENDKILEIGGTLQQRINDCLDVLNTFLLNDKAAVVASMVVAEKKQAVAGSVVECVANIMNIKDISSVSLQSTLAELGMDSMMAVEIKQTLERDYDIILTPKELRSLTFAKLVDLSVTDSSANVKNEIDLRLFNSFPTEELSKSILVELPSKKNENPNSPPIFFIPGLVGVSPEFNTVSAQLDAKVLSLQLTPSNSFTTVEEIARTFLPVILSNLKPSERLNIVAHSYGTFIALEICIMLEKEGFQGNIICIDGSPQALHKLTTGILNADDPAAVETYILYNVYNTFVQGEQQNFMTEIGALGSWDERKAKVFEKLENLSETPARTKIANYSAEYTNDVCDSWLKRTKSIFNYNIASKKNALKSTQIKLVKAKSSLIRDQVEDYELSEFLNGGTVDVVTLEGDHISVLENDKLAVLINNICS